MLYQHRMLYAAVEGRESGTDNNRVLRSDLKPMLYMLLGTVRKWDQSG